MKNVYFLPWYIESLLNYKVMEKELEESDYVKVAKVFFQFQYLLTKLVATRCYNFMESTLAENKKSEFEQVQSKVAGKSTVPEVMAGKAVTKAVASDNRMVVSVDSEKRSLMTGPAHSVKAAKALTGKVVGMPFQAASYAANLSWNMASKVAKSLKSKSPFTADDDTKPSAMNLKSKKEFVQSLLAAKEASGKTFSQIAESCDITNVYCAQLFYNQAQLKRGHTADMLKRAVPELTVEQIEEMCRAPVRMYDPHLLQEPTICRLQEIVCQYGESIKALINEECGDGTMSSVDFYMTLDKVRDTTGQERIIISFNGKYEPHIEQRMDENITLL